jgi:hypothetical protein
VIAKLPRSVLGTQPADGAKFSERIARTPVRFRCLPRPQLAAVPHRRRMNPALRRVLRDSLDQLAPVRRQRPLRVEVFRQRLAVVYEDDELTRRR